MTTIIMMMMTMTWQIHKYCTLIHSFLQIVMCCNPKINVFLRSIYTFPTYHKLLYTIMRRRKIRIILMLIVTKAGSVSQ